MNKPRIIFPGFSSPGLPLVHLVGRSKKEELICSLPMYLYNTSCFILLCTTASTNPLAFTGIYLFWQQNAKYCYFSGNHRYSSFYSFSILFPSLDITSMVISELLRASAKASLKHTNLLQALNLTRTHVNSPIHEQEITLYPFTITYGSILTIKQTAFYMPRPFSVASLFSKVISTSTFIQHLSAHFLWAHVSVCAILAAFFFFFYRQPIFTRSVFPSSDNTVALQPFLNQHRI